MSLSWPGPLPLTLPPLSLSYSLVEEGVVREDLKVTISFLNTPGSDVPLIWVDYIHSDTAQQPRLIGHSLCSKIPD